MGGGEVPFAHRVGVVALIPQDLGEETVFKGDLTIAAREARRPLGDAGHAVAVVVAAGDQAGPGGGAEGGGVEIGVAEPSCG